MQANGQILFTPQLEAGRSALPLFAPRLEEAAKSGREKTESRVQEQSSVLTADPRRGEAVASIANSRGRDDGQDNARGGFVGPSSQGTAAGDGPRIVAVRRIVAASRPVEDAEGETPVRGRTGGRRGEGPVARPSGQGRGLGQDGEGGQGRGQDAEGEQRRGQGRGQDAEGEQGRGQGRGQDAEGEQGRGQGRGQAASSVALLDQRRGREPQGNTALMCVRTVHR